MENTQEIIKVARGRPRKPRPIEEENIEKRPRGRPRKPTPPPKPKLPRKPKTPKEVSVWRDDRQLYFRMYYQNRKKEECPCPHCGNEFDSKLTLGKHLIRSVMCRKTREQKTNESQELSNLD